MTASWVDETWLSLDTETTGIDVFSDRIVQVAAVQVHPDGSIGDTYCTIVNPGIDIPAEASAIHGISTEQARDEGVEPSVALAEVARRIFEHGHRPVIGFNMGFDWPILLSEAERHDVEFPFLAPVLDPFLVDRMMDQYRKGSRKLVSVAQHYAVALDEVDAHGALADATAAALVMRAIVARYPQVGERSLASVFLRQVRGHERWREGFVDYKHRQGDTTFDIAPGWPIPAVIKGGLPVIAPAAEPVAQDPPPGHGGDVGKGEGTADADPAASSPDPEREPAIGVKDVAKLAGEVFKPDHDAAPRGQKTKVVDRLRYAVTFAQTAGSATSLDGLAPEHLLKVHARLRDIAGGALKYRVDDDAVVFTSSSGKETRIEWAQLETPTEPAAAAPAASAA